MTKSLLLSAVLLAAAPLPAMAADTAAPSGEAGYTAQDTDPKGVTPRPGINVDTAVGAGQAADTDPAPDYEGGDTDPKGVTPRPGINVEDEPPRDGAHAGQPDSPVAPDARISTGAGAGGD